MFENIVTKQQLIPSDSGIKYIPNHDLIKLYPNKSCFLCKTNRNRLAIH